jgi:serine protease Do
MMELLTRRRYVQALGTVAAAGLAGCSASGQQSTNATEDKTTTGNATDGENATAAESPYTQVYQDSIQSVALITATTSQGKGKGSGFVYRDNYLVTNAHVVSDATDVRVQFNRGEYRSATVVGTDVSSDLAVLEVQNKPDYATALPWVKEQPMIGAEVVAIGNPYGRFDGSASAGIVSGVNRSIPAQNGFTIPDAIQTDAAVNPGNSGGPLVNLGGRVTGVINSGGGENIAFAISAALVERVVPALIKNGEYTHAYMGASLTTVTPKIAQANDLKQPRGVYVHRVLPDGPAAGVLQGSKSRQRPIGGDVIVAINGQKISTRQQLSSYLALQASPGETIDVTVLRNGGRRTVQLELGGRPQSQRPNGASPEESPTEDTPITR